MAPAPTLRGGNNCFRMPALKASAVELGSEPIKVTKLCAGDADPLLYAQVTDLKESVLELSRSQVAGGFLQGGCGSDEAVKPTQVRKGSAPPLLRGTTSKMWMQPDESNLREGQCKRCHILGQQVRALARALAGLSASTFNWSEGLTDVRRYNLARLILDYTSPCAHVDEELRTTVGDLELAKWAEKSSFCREFPTSSNFKPTTVATAAAAGPLSDAPRGIQLDDSFKDLVRHYSQKLKQDMGYADTNFFQQGARSDAFASGDCMGKPLNMDLGSEGSLGRVELELANIRRKISGQCPPQLDPCLKPCGAAANAFEVFGTLPSSLGCQPIRPFRELDLGIGGCMQELPQGVAMNSPRGEGASSSTQLKLFGSLPDADLEQAERDPRKVFGDLPRG